MKILKAHLYFCSTVDVKVNSIHVCVCLEFLLNISDFFVKGLPKDQPAPPPPSVTTEANKGTGYFKNSVALKEL